MKGTLANMSIFRNFINFSSNVSLSYDQFLTVESSYIRDAISKHVSILFDGQIVNTVKPRYNDHLPSIRYSKHTLTKKWELSRSTIVRVLKEIIQAAEEGSDAKRFRLKKAIIKILVTLSSVTCEGGTISKVDCTWNYRDLI